MPRKRGRPSLLSSLRVLLMPELGRRRASAVCGQDRVPPPSETVVAVARGRVGRGTAGGAPAGPAARLDGCEQDLNVN